MRQESIVIDLERVPAECNVGIRPQPSVEVGKSEHLYNGRLLPRDSAERAIRRQRVNGLHAVIVVHCHPVEAKPTGIDQAGTENVILFQDRELSKRLKALQDILETVGFCQKRVIVKVGREYAVLIRKLVIASERKIVLIDNSLRRKSEDSCIPSRCEARIGQWPER